LIENPLNIGDKLKYNRAIVENVRSPQEQKEQMLLRK
jgi:hypothetical protein